MVLNALFCLTQFYFQLPMYTIFPQSAVMSICFLNLSVGPTNPWVVVEQKVFLLIHARQVRSLLG